MREVSEREVRERERERRGREGKELRGGRKEQGASCEKGGESCELCIFTTQYVEFKYFALKCQHLDLNPSVTLNTQIH